MGEGLTGVCGKRAGARAAGSSHYGHYWTFGEISRPRGAVAMPASDHTGTAASPCVHDDGSHVETSTFYSAVTGTVTSPCNHGYINNTSMSVFGNTGAGTTGGRGGGGW